MNGNSRQNERERSRDSEHHAQAWDRQEVVPGRDVLLLPGAWFSIELAASTPVPEWSGEELSVALEEDAVADETGRVSWVLHRQTAYHLVK